MKTAYIFEYKDRLVFAPGCYTTKGFLLAWPPISAITSRTPAEIGALIASALANSKEGIPHPSSWNGLFDPVLKAAGAASLVKFHESAKCVVAEQENDVLLLKPLRNAGKKGGFVQTDTVIPCVHAQASDYGEMLLLALTEAS